ncbi:MAG TPA: hypothetical protein VFU02_03630, partial [Polyangiaceae bacterium]|nr:hypothetical protein [Polyangiaceae bacterium]
MVSAPSAARLAERRRLLQSQQRAVANIKQGLWATSLAAGVLLASGPAACGRTPLLTGELVTDTQPLAPPDDTQRLVFGAVDKVDLLFVIDNSISMADKQELLKEAVPTLLERLINPPCISAADRNDAVHVDGPSAVCPSGYQKEFEPLIDLHVGVITSSLGSHGGDICSEDFPSFNPTNNDRGHLLASVRAGLPAYSAAGFLAWDPAGQKQPPGDHEVGPFLLAFQNHVVAAGEAGCGYEATQEAWYRFLVEPNPYAEIEVDDRNLAVPVGTDRTLLEQRNEFLRPDSLLMIVVLSDEDDCSVIDAGVGWLTSTAALGGSSFTFPPATSACADDPNSACCRSCEIQESRPPAGCGSLSDDPACRAPSASADPLHLRCHRQKERFGLDLLYPIERYTGALENLTVEDTRRCEEPGATNDPAECPRVVNPLFAGKRDPSLVIYTAIVGVPWQDIATSESLTGVGLEYLNAHELEELDRWRLILGDPERGEPPLDPLMIASSAPRTGEHPLLGEALAPPDSLDPRANSINGHEFFNDGSDLQYACTFPLRNPRECADAEGCDCREPSMNRPLCNPPGGGAAQTTQYYAKAYPGPRHLAIAKALGDTASVASICPKVIDPPTSAPAYGYNAAAEHMYARLAGGLGERCLSEALPHTSDGRAECVLWQLKEDGGD